MSTRIPDPLLAPDEEELDQTLRPRRLSEFVGQDAVKEQLSIFLAAAKARSEPCEHVLLAGPPGLGKTSLAGIIAAEMGSVLRVMSGPAIDRKADMAAILTALEPADVLFIDEIHRLNRAIEELLYPAMEDGCIDIVIGQGPGSALAAAGAEAVHAGRRNHPHGPADHAASRSLRHHAPARPLQRGRAGADRAALVADPRASGSTTTPATRSHAARGARRASQTGSCAASATSPRSGTEERCPTRSRSRRWSCSRSTGSGSSAWTARSCAPSRSRSAAGRSALSTLAVAIGEQPDTLEDVYEPYLLQLGLMQRTPRGRVVTPAAFEHLGLPPPARDPRLF